MTPALRAFRSSDVAFLDRLGTDPDALGPFEWLGFTDASARRRRLELDGYVGADSTALAVVLPDDDTVVGIASWKSRDRGVPPGVCYEIGCALVAEHRGRGLGTAAQRLLVDYLFDYTTVHRLEALTDARNVAEQRVLERLGFRREGHLRERSFLHGTYTDVLIYGLLRREARPQPSVDPI